MKISKIIIILLLFISCDTKKTLDDILINKIYVENNVESIVIVQENACHSCFDNAVSFVNNYKNKNKLIIVFITKYKKKQLKDFDFLEIDIENKILYYDEDNTFSEILLRESNSFSKGLFLLKIKKKRCVDIIPF